MKDNDDLILGVIVGLGLGFLGGQMFEMTFHPQPMVESTTSVSSSSLPTGVILTDTNTGVVKRITTTSLPDLSSTTGSTSGVIITECEGYEGCTTKVITSGN